MAIPYVNVDWNGAISNLKEANSNFPSIGPINDIINDGLDSISSKLTNDGSSGFDFQELPSLSDYMKNNPDLSYEDYLKWMSTQSDEWAEKYLDYLTEKGELDRANQYTADREDTAYQRLVQDLQKAGLNPAMMYGSSASPSASGSQGYVKMTEGANSRSVSNYSKLKNLILQFMMYELKKNLGSANTIIKGVGTIGQIIGSFFG